MLNLKKTAIAVLALGSSAVFAGTMGPVCKPGDVTVPCPSEAWDLGAQALFLQPTYSNGAYLGSIRPGTDEVYVKAPYNWGWGFKIEGSYHFNTGNDLNLNWYHYDHTTKLLDSSLLVPGFDGTPLTDASQTIKPRWDAVNLEFGQHAHFGEWQNLRFHGGVQYAHVQTNVNINANVAVAVIEELPAFVFPVQGSAITKYNGFGPRIGADYWYNWGNGFSMYAKGASALLVGGQSFNVNTVVAGVPNIATGSTTAIVPEVELKLGASYTYALPHGDLMVDLGWMWVNYFQVFAAPSPVGLGDTEETNFALQGPYIGVKWIGNVA